MRILIVKLSAIGDVIHTLPAAALLKRTIPDAHIAWAVEAKAGALLQDSPVIDTLIEIDAKGLRQSLFGSPDFKERRSSSHPSTRTNHFQDFDVAIDFQGLLKSGFIVNASRAPRRVGFETADLREKLSRIFLTEQVQTAAIAHVIDKNLALARSVIDASPECHSISDYQFPIAISPQDEQYITQNALNQASRFAILNPGGGWDTKRWDRKNFAALADWLWDHYRLVSFVTFGPGEESLAQSVIQNSRTQKALPFPATLKQFAALARRAEIFIGGDTGPLHLAAACGTPIVGLFGPTSPDRNGPFDKLDLTVGLDLWCREKCHRRRCWHWQCMDIPLAKVAEAISIRLKRAAIEETPTEHPLAFNV